MFFFWKTFSPKKESEFVHVQFFHLLLSREIFVLGSHFHRYADIVISPLIESSMWGELRCIRSCWGIKNFLGECPKPRGQTQHFCLEFFSFGFSSLFCGLGFFQVGTNLSWLLRHLEKSFIGVFTTAVFWESVRGTQKTLRNRVGYIDGLEYVVRLWCSDEVTMLWADRFSWHLINWSICQTWFLFFSIQPRSKVSKLSFRIVWWTKNWATDFLSIWPWFCLQERKKPLVVTFVAVKKSLRILLATLLMHAFLTWCYNSSHLK